MIHDPRARTKMSHKLCMITPRLLHDGLFSEFPRGYFVSHRNIEDARCRALSNSEEFAKHAPYKGVIRSIISKFDDTFA